MRLTHYAAHARDCLAWLIIGRLCPFRLISLLPARVVAWAGLFTCDAEPEHEA